jgi:hypothetical protein
MGGKMKIGNCKVKPKGLIISIEDGIVRVGIFPQS